MGHPLQAEQLFVHNLVLLLKFLYFHNFNSKEMVGVVLEVALPHHPKVTMAYLTWHYLKYIEEVLVAHFVLHLLKQVYALLLLLQIQFSVNLVIACPSYIPIAPAHPGLPTLSLLCSHYYFI